MPNEKENACSRRYGRGHVQLVKRDVGDAEWGLERRGHVVGSRRAAFYMAEHAVDSEATTVGRTSPVTSRPVMRIGRRISTKSSVTGSTARPAPSFENER